MTFDIIKMGYFNPVLSFSHSGVRAMSDQDKSKEQLIEELKDMCLKMAELEAVQKSLNKKESRYREIVDETSAAIFVIQDGHVKFVNNATMKLTGYSKKEDLSSPAIETFVHPDDRDMVNQYHIRRLQGDNAPFRYDYRFVCKDGTVKWAEMNSSLIMWEGEPAGLCLVTDITERKRVEEALRSNEEKFRTVFETANDAIFLMDGEKFINWGIRMSPVTPTCCGLPRFGFRLGFGLPVLGLSRPPVELVDRRAFRMIWRSAIEFGMYIRPGSNQDGKPYGSLMCSYQPTFQQGGHSIHQRQEIVSDISILANHPMDIVVR